MTKKSKIIYIVGSVVIGVAAALIILLGLMLGGALDGGGNVLVISSASREFVYNGESREDGGWQLVSGRLSAGHKISAEVSGVQREAGSSLNYITATVSDADGGDVTSKYRIEYRTGTLTVLARPITVTTAEGEKIYDGKELSHREWEITKGSLAKGQEISVSMTASITDAGEIENTAAAQIYDGDTEVTRNYAITYDTGLLRVDPIELHFITPTLSKTYDGLPLFSGPDGYEWVSGALLPGHSATSVKVVGRITGVGEIENSVEIKIAAADGADISKNYLAVIDSGTLTVRGFGITVITASGEKVYDGTPLVRNEWSLYESTPLIPGHAVSKIVLPASQTNAGASPNEISRLVIVDEKGEDVTGNYEIDYSIGTLVVLPRPLTVQSGSASKQYDGKPLTCGEWKFTSYYEPVSGQRAEVVVSGSITEVGQRENTIAQVLVFDKGGNDLSGNYDITLDEGLLIVKGAGTGANSGDLDESGNISGGENGEGGGEDTPALGVKTESGGTVYLRLKSFGSYDGKKWSEAAEYGKTFNGYSFNYAAGCALKQSGYTAENISIAVYGTGYYLPYYMTADGEYDVQTSDVYNRGSSKNYSLLYYPCDYISSPINTALSGSEIEGYNAFVHANYTSVPQSTKAYLQSVIDAQGFKAGDNDLIKKVAYYVRGAAEYSLDYDKGLDSESDIVLAFLRDYRQGVCRHYASAATLLLRQLGYPARYTIGYVAATAAGEWVEVTAANAHAWVEVYIDGVGWVQVEVTGGSSAGGALGGEQGGNGGSGEQGVESGTGTKIKPVTEYYKYDGRTAFSHSGALQGLSKLTEAGYTYKAEISGAFKSPGKYSVEIKSFALYDPGGKDVTEDFEFSFKAGTLQVYQYEITVKTGSAEKVYDGLPLSSASCEISKGRLADGHTLEYLRTISSRTDAGASVNSYEIMILDGDGDDVGYKYKINSDYGYLTVTAREITVTAGSAEKVYDGAPLTFGGYDVSGSLAAGHSAYVTVSGENGGRAGSAENKITSVKITDGTGKDVTLNYAIYTVSGLLTVYP